ncbi:MAG: cytochrome c-type biogenesis protein CcmH [Alphaproteobacteria bacterium]|nr:MAG: cytochrome c-type biogenesis protein CcmH [Alphaproteobacteria bacterium]
MRLIFAFLVMLGLGSIQAAAVQPDEVLDDPVLEERARKISLGLRCLVCQNQSIDDSNAPLARDLRLLVRERLKKGDSDEQVLEFLVARYGEFVLLKPRFGWHTLLLWTGAPILLLIAVVFMMISYRKRNSGGGAAHAPELTAEEKRKLKKVLAGRN